MSREKSTKNYAPLQVSCYHTLMAMNEARKIVSAELSSAAKRSLDSVASEHGMKHKVMLGRVVEWFAALSKTERAWVLQQTAEADEWGIAALILARLEPADAAEQALKAARQLRRFRSQQKVAE